MVISQSRFAKGAVACALSCTLASAAFVPAAFAPESFAFASGPSAPALQASGTMIVFDQALIDRVGLQSVGGSCLGYAAAYAKTITTGEVHGWWEYDYNGGAYGESGFYGKNMNDEFECRVINSESGVLAALYEAVNEGRPTILYVTTGSGSQHWVTVVGYENVSDPNDLTPGNFLILDPDSTTTTEPESLASRGLSLRFGDRMGNVRVSRASAATNDGRVPSEHFSDCYFGDWFVDSGCIDYVFDRGIMTGLSGTTRFDPAGQLTRGQAVTILHRIAGSPEPKGDALEFSDVDYSRFDGAAIRWARETGVVGGVGDNRFLPDGFITREELAVMIENYARTIAHLDTASDGVALATLADSETVSAWAAPSLSWCVDAGVITGQVEDAGTFMRPQNLTTRAQMAKVATVLSRDVLGQGQG